MKSKRPSPLVFTRPGAPPPAETVSPGPAVAPVSDPSVSEPQESPIPTETYVAGALGDPGPDSLDLQAFEIKPPESLGSVTPSGQRRPAALESESALPLLNSAASVDETVAAPRAWPVIAVASVVSAVWALTPLMFAWGYRREVAPFGNDGFALAVFVMLSLGPAGLVWVAAYVLHQARKLSAETRRAQALADSLMQPAALAARGAGNAVDLVRQEIKAAASVAEQARSELLSLREVLAAESQRLLEAAQSSGRTAGMLTQSLGGERERMSLITTSLEEQATKVTEAISRQGRMVAEASDLAETQIREAEAALAARAADLAAAAGEASDAARMAAEDLTRQVARLETAGLGVGDQARIVEETLTQQRAALVTAAHGMRADHEALAAEAESQMAQLREILVHARSGAGEISESAAQAGQDLRHVIAQAADQIRQIAETAAEERDHLSAGAAQSLGAVSEIAAREREALERSVRQAIDALIAATDEAAKAAAEQAEIARQKVDQLGEAAFAAGQKADQTFDLHMREARGLIEQSAALIDEAGSRAQQKLAEGLASTQATLKAMEDLLGDLDSRIDRMPDEAKVRADAVRASIEQGMDELMASARRAADETQAIDAAFQDRVRRNYEMLSEAVRLMGVVAGAAGTVSPRPAAAAAPAPVQAVPRTEAPRPTAEPGPAPPPNAADAGLRPRLKLTPTATDEEFKSVFESAGGREHREPPEPAGDSWTWKELLSSMDEPGDAAPAGGGSDEALLNEIDAMGIDAAALLPRPRIDEIGAAVNQGEPAMMRAIVRRLAPAAIRRLSRRMLTDRPFRAHAERFTSRYQGLLDDAVSERNATVVAALLGSDQGRAFLLIDAAGEVQ
ncbi:polar localization protein TipN [Phenylobacterium montanum]|uniref:Polar localization protein TipN n=1 Tax=Phenylobacterium montanum TaxID=2823693 RepID=A0A975G4P2_9CAUL|nr:polar localization protein TipN [Caulobacter sp. S6]QUD89981.1 polar localization protein TipN [Caulobacter sp. S6]